MTNIQGGTTTGGRSVAFPTPWNQLEAGILFSLGVPLLVFRDQHVSGGVFDKGVTDLFVHQLPDPNKSKESRKALQEVIRKWASKVRTHYYKEK
jgi:hypothetical protein